MHKLSAEIKPIRPFTHYESHNSLVLKSRNQLQKNKKNLIKPDVAFADHWDKLVVEIGCGSGLHPIQWAKNNPNAFLIAIERTKHKFLSFQNRLNSHQLNNIYPVNQDALYWLPLHMAEATVDEYFFLYPNPYPKEKQANKRWHRNSLFHFILKSLKTNGFITFASNELSYIQECELYCRDFWNLNLIQKDELIDRKDFQYRTHFEKKYLKSKQTCYNLIYQKK